DRGRAYIEPAHRGLQQQLPWLRSLLNKGVHRIASFVGNVIQRIPGYLANVSRPAVVMHARAQGLEAARANIGDLELARAQHAIEQLPAAHPVIRGALADDIPRLKDLVDLVGNGMAVANLLEVSRVKIGSHNAPPLSVFSA